MIQTLQMPFIETSLPNGKILRWMKEPDEPFAFGDQLCIIVVEDAVFLRKSRSASRLTGTKQRRKWTKHRIETHPIGRIEIEVIAAEPGTMRTHVAGAGEPVGVGDIIAVLQTGDDEFVSPGSDVFADLPPLRVVANHLDTGEG